MATDHIQQKFEKFHQDNPHVYSTLVKLVEEWLATGRRRLAIGALWERLRWELGITTYGDDGFGLNDHHRSRYARLLTERHPEWPEGLFELRKLRAASAS